MRVCDAYWIFHGETGWSLDGRAVLYSLCLAYCFAGIAGCTTPFMRAMDVMVRQKWTVRSKDPETGIEVVRKERIWNSTVADITLLAIGTSVPPISISFIETFGNISAVKDSGYGVGIIVGSASFNLLVTSAVCVVVPKKGTVKLFQNFGVYTIELIWSLWAYVWLYIVLKVSSPNVVTLWEAVLTALQFPLLVVHAYIQDTRGFCGRGMRKHSSLMSIPQGLRKHSSVMSIPQELRKWDHSDPTDSELQADAYDLPEENDLPRTYSYSLPKETIDEHDLPRTYSYSLPNETIEEQDVWVSWKQQFLSLGDLKGTSGDFSLVFTLGHLIMLPWNLVFSFIPPVCVAHGWVTYLCAIVVIAAQSKLVIQLADVIGCVTGISSYMLAVSVLAAGSSWPVLIASKISTKHAPTADAAIANVNCSNSINSFVGLGIPWLLHAVYNQFVLHDNFEVPTDGVAFSLILFFVGASLCSTVLALRRYFLNGEFGGPSSWAWASSLLFLASWIASVAFACLKFADKL